MRIRTMTMLVFLLLLSLSGTASVEAAQPRPLTVMTQNMFQGSELEAVLGATTFESFVHGVTITYDEVVASHPAERIAAMASEIALANPDLVGLQEAALWRTGPLGGTSASDVAFDFVQMLVSTLDQRGAHYVAVAITNNLDAEAPSTLGFDVRYTDRVAILARADLVAPTSDISNVQTHNYAAAAVFYSQVIGPIRILDGWSAVDAKVRGQSVTFATTHLAALSTGVGAAQAQELSANLNSSPYPVIVVGDFNALSNIGSNGAYAVMAGNGFADSWRALRIADPGYTCCATATTSPDQRIDYVFTRGAAVATGAQVVGISPGDRTKSGQWPSDHAGVITRLVLG